ncbi:hypothetical protein F442_15399 [Phytophthora nicotianae P10297]|uniref:Uncharacterized protein n=1 Tax=Phytophthora nicotianae P10297 TaxID=1317064 RepID=W2YRD6_PHYNI|nr:hypothetical protein F442_15399 [Phytophthora nicotianae P10297]
MSRHYGSDSVKSKPRPYPPAVYENPGSRWASPLLPVRKQGVTGDEYRQTCDYRLVNDLTEALISTMPNMTTSPLAEIYHASRKELVKVPATSAAIVCVLCMDPLLMSV